MRPIVGELLEGDALYRRVVLERIVGAKESVWIATANVKAMMVEQDGAFVPLTTVLATLAKRGVALRLLHADLPSRPFRKFFDRERVLVRGGLELKVCPRVHFKCVLVDNAWLYFGSANLTGAGLGAKHKDGRNFELGLVSEDFDTIDRITALYESVWSGIECKKCRLFRECPDPIGPGPQKLRAKAKRGAMVLGRARKIPRKMDE